MSDDPIIDRSPRRLLPAQPAQGRGAEFGLETLALALRARWLSSARWSSASGWQGRGSPIRR